MIKPHAVRGALETANWCAELTSDVHHDVEDEELASGQGADHDATGGEADGGKVVETDFTRDAAEAGHNGALATCENTESIQVQRAFGGWIARRNPVLLTGAGLVDLGEEGVSGVGDDGGGDAGNDAWCGNGF
jgi:hypothetical protein